MIIEKAKTYFQKYPQLKVLFFFDADEEYQEEISQSKDLDIKIIICDKGLFGIKYRLEFELSDQKVFLYFPNAKPDQTTIKKFPLLDILVANKEQQVDDITDFVEEYGLSAHQKGLVKIYIRELKVKKVQRVLSKVLNPTDFDERSIIQGLISTYLGFTQIMEPSICLTKMFTLALPENEIDWLTFVKNMQSMEAEDTIKKWFNEYLDHPITELTREDVLSAVKRLKYNLLTLDIKEISGDDPYKKLKINKTSTINRLSSFLSDWQNEEKLTQELETVFSTLAGDIKEDSMLEIYGHDGNYAYYTKPLIFLILEKIIADIPYHPDQVLKLLLKLLDPIAYGKGNLKPLLDFFYHTTHFYKILNSIESFILDKPDNYIDNYINIYEKIDFYYRKAAGILPVIDKLELPGDFTLEVFIDDLHQKYETYLKDLNSQWLKCLQETGFNFKSISADKQYSFYQKYIKDSEQKTVVIISDALRYETAHELVTELHVDTKGQAKINYMLASVPSNTSLGMSNLLPNQGISIVNDSFTINELSTEGLINRQKILQSVEPEARAITFDKLEQMTQVEAREIFKSKLVYVYHNAIDAIGDDKKTEKRIYEAVHQAIEELKIIIKKIHSSWNVSRVLVTADHGFIFQQRALPEAMYEAMPKDSESVIVHNRFIITKGSGKSDHYLFTLKNVSNIDSDLQVIIPRAINRFKRQGSGVHYVHGGASLQELIVPVIESSRKREDIAEKVNFTLLSKDLKIISGAIKLKILQNEPIGELIKSRTIIMGLYDTSNELISNETDMLMESTSELPTNRTKEIILNLTNKAGQTSICYLQIYEKKDDPDKLNPLVKEKVINKTLIETDF